VPGLASTSAVQVSSEGSTIALRYLVRHDLIVLDLDPDLNVLEPFREVLILDQRLGPRRRSMTDHGEAGERCRLASVTLVIAGEPTTTADPCEGAFSRPSVSVRMWRLRPSTFLPASSPIWESIRVTQLGSRSSPATAEVGKLRSGGGSSFYFS
jgi:hypothetical protein